MMACGRNLKCQLKPLKNIFYHEIIELRCCTEWSGYARGNTAIFLVRPYLSNPRDLDFFKRNICICCSPPFYFSLFALGATSLRDQMTCRIFHFLLLGQDSCVSKYVRQELLHDKHSVIQSNPRLTIVCRAEWKYERLSYWISQNSVKSSCWS